MGDTERGNIDMIHRLQSNPFGALSRTNNHLDVSQLNISQIRPPLPQNAQNLQNFGSENGKKSGLPPSHPPMPPISPYSHIPVARPGSQHSGLQNSGHGPAHSRSLLQPSFFMNDSLPPLSPSPYQNSTSGSSSGQDIGTSNGSLENRVIAGNLLLPPSLYGRSSLLHITEGLPPRKLHRRSISDIAFGFDSVFQSSSPPSPLVSPGPRGSGSERTLSGGSAKPVKKESIWGKTRDASVEGEVVDDLLSTFMNLDSFDVMNSSETDEKYGNEKYVAERFCWTYQPKQRTEVPLTIPGATSQAS